MSKEDEGKFLADLIGRVASAYLSLDKSEGTLRARAELKMAMRLITERIS